MSYGNIAGSSALVMNVKRKEPELVRPARPTPSGLKPLSDMDVQEQLRYQPSTIMVYAATRGMKDKDPAKVIKSALAEALVYYYPVAGRLREAGPGGELMVDCTAEGVVFVEADAAVRADQLPVLLLPPIPFIEELVYNKEAILTAVIGFPLITLQVTNFMCGGFILAFSNSHIMGDLIGIIQFLANVTELARGASAPSILPVWRRELLLSCDTTNNANANTLSNINPAVDRVDNLPMVRRLLFFGRREVETLRNSLPEHLKSSASAYELITACLWRCRTLALRYKPHERVRLQFVVNARDILDPPLPRGYYGNACSHAQVICPAGRVCEDSSLGYVVHQMKQVKNAMTDEYVRSHINMSRRSRQPPPTMSQRLYIVSDVSKCGLSQLDFGWGKPLYAGPADEDPLPGIITYILAFRNRKGGEDEKVVPVWLPADAMDRFVMALPTSLLKDHSKL